MENELLTLYSTVDFYKKSLVDTLNKIEKLLLQTIQNYEDTHTRESSTAKYNLSMQMVEVLQTYIKLHYTSTNLASDLISSSSQLERHSVPERGKRNSNPFVLSTLNELDVSLETNDLTVAAENIEIKKENTGLSITNINYDCDSDNTVVADRTNNIDSALLTTINSDYDSDRTIVAEISNNVDNALPKKSEIKTESIEPVLDSEVPTQESSIEKKKTNEEVKRQVSFNLSPEALGPVSGSPETIPKNSAIEKLRQLPRYDWREEAIKLLEDKSMKKSLKWKVVPPQKCETPPGRVKEKSAIFAIVDNDLCCGMTCIICYVESPSEFYVQADQKLFSTLETHFNDALNDQYLYHINNFKSKSEAKACLGDYCFTFLPNYRKWFRVEVLDWIEEENDTDIYIQLIDYGEKMFWSYTNLKPMTEFYALFPQMAIKCHLAAVYPPNSGINTTWPKACVDFFVELTEMDKCTEFLTIYVCKENGSYAVDLVKASEKDGDSLGQTLVDKGYAFQVDFESDNTAESIDEEDTEFDNITEAITGYDAKDEARICPFTDSSGRCFKGPKCKLEHSKLSNDGITTDKVPTMNQALAKLKLPAAGDVVEILITGYIDTCHFYVNILQNRSRGEMYNDKFQNLKDAMMANNNVQTYEQFKVNPGLGELLLVKHNKEWLRGECVGYTENNEIEVFLIDFGETILKKLKYLRQMKEDLLYVPFQAVRCILNDCQEKKDVSKADSKRFFLQCMYRKILLASIVDSSSLPIRIRVQDNDLGMEMGLVLKQFGLGEDRTKDLYPAKNSLLSFD